MSLVTQKFSELTKSPLVQRLALGFVCIVLVDLAFVGAICTKAFQAEKQAAHEYRIIKAAQRVSDIADKLRLHRVIVDNSRFYPEANRAAHDASCNRIKTQLKQLQSDWQDAGLPADQCKKLVEIIENICATTPYMFVDGAVKEKRKAVYSSFLESSTRLYEQSMVTMQDLRALIRAQNEENDGYDSLGLCLAAVAANGIICLVAAFMLDSGITRPITRLANTCKNLIVGEVIPAPASSATEIGQLEATFHDMSSTVARAEHARKEFLKQMQDVQEVTLEHVRRSISKLASAYGDNPQTEKHFALMKTNVDGMLLLLSSMTYGLNFSLEDEVVIKPTKYNTTELLEVTASMVDWLMQKSRFELVIEDPQLELELDSALIQRVLVNLLSNAAKYSSNRAEIKLSAIPLEKNDTGKNDKPAGEGLVRFEVRDTGCGISPENVGKLFQKYSQVEASDGVRRPGSGLGLLICKKIVEAHGGEIGCESELGVGSCFWFVIPRKVNDAGQRSAGVESPEVSKTPSSKPYRGNLKRTLFILLSIYACCQIGLAVSLGNQLEHARQTYQTYTQHKNTILGTQELMTAFLTWRQNAAMAFLSGDMQAFFDMIPLLKQLKEQAEKLGAVVEPDSKIQKCIAQIIQSMTKLDDIAIGVLDVDRMSQQEIDNAFKDADKQGYVIEDSLFWILSEERHVLPSSYDLAFQLRSQILWTLVFATLVNTLVLIILCLIGLNIISKVTELNAKAKGFARGGDVIPTLSVNLPPGGMDELAFLDERLCDVAQKVRFGQKRRQDLMAVINHDLRTPLGTLLAGLEMLSSGMLGDVSDDTEKLIERTDTEVRSVLSIINEFLDTDKSQFQSTTSN